MLANVSRREVPWGMEGRPYSSVDYFPDPRVRWGLPQAVVIVALLPITEVLTRTLPLLSLDPIARSVLDRLLGVGFYAAFLANVLVASRRRGLAQLGRDFGFAVTPTDVVLAIGLVVAIEFVNILDGIMIQGITGIHPAPDLDLAGASVGTLLVVSFGALIAAPFVEELSNRGLIMRAVRHSILRAGSGSSPSSLRRNAARTLSVVVSAVVFSALHLPDRIGTGALPFELVGTLVAGLFFGYVATRTGRIGATITAHILLNFIALVLTAHR